MSFPIRVFPERKLPAASAEPLFVMTDLHGSAEAMRRLLSKRPEGHRLVFLGDSTDRGLDSLGVLKFLDSEKDAVLLRGNHDIMAWFSCHFEELPETEFDFMKIRELHELWLRYNGGATTFGSFVADYGITETSMSMRNVMRLIMERHGHPVFDAVWNRSLRHWRSGGLFFVHGGMPADADEAWLEKPEWQAVTMSWDTEDHWAWYRPKQNPDGYYDREARPAGYVVCGHTPQEPGRLIHEYGMFLDTGYSLKTAAIIDGDRLQLVMTPCDEVTEPSDAEIALCEWKN